MPVYTSPEHRDQIIMQMIESDIGETSIDADTDIANDIVDDDDDHVQGIDDEHVPHTRISRKRAKRVSFEDTTIDDDDEYNNKKSVSFSNISEMFVVPDLRSIVSKTAQWYSIDDMSRLKFNHLRKIHTTRLKLSIGDQSTDIVGLEKHLSSALSLEFKRRKRSHVNAIINELEFQDEYCSQPNPDRLAAISRNHSRWALEQAQYAAKLLQDFVEVADDVSTSSTETASMSESDDSSSSTSSSKFKVEYDMRRLTIDAVAKDCSRAVAA